MEGQFELILEGTSGYSEPTRRQISAILSSHRGTPSCLEQELPGSSVSTLSVMTSNNRLALEIICNEISAAGGKVAIVSRGRKATRMPAPRRFPDYYRSYSEKLSRTLSLIDPFPIDDLVHDLVTARALNQQIFIFGDEGSSSCAAHWARNLSRHQSANDANPLRVILLTGDSSSQSSNADKCNSERIFTDQLANRLQPNDLVIGLSACGKSEAISAALQLSTERGAKTYAIVSFTGGSCMSIAHKSIYIPARVGEFGLVHDCFSIIGHMLGDYLEEHGAQCGD